jgi:hypothetical protein
MTDIDFDHYVSAKMYKCLLDKYIIFVIQNSITYTFSKYCSNK